MQKTRDTRLAQLQQWIFTTLTNNMDVHIEAASADASFRRYFRLQYQGKSYIAMDAPPDKENILTFIDITGRLLACDVQAPVIFHQNTTDGFLLLSDLGQTDYLSQLNTDSADKLYREAMQALLTIQKKANTVGLPDYNEILLNKELCLFTEWFLNKHLNIKLTAKQQTIMQQTFRLLTDNALEQTRVFVHRDYHSRNLMMTLNHNPGIIDYQDAVLGPITYDLVSLLRDCYISWPEERVYTWVNQYYDSLLTARLTNASYPQFIYWFDLMGIQRHLKAIGIFARLKHRDGKAAYLNDIPRTFHYVMSVSQKYPALQAFYNLLQDINIIDQLNSVDY